jgi:hypothetical protein
MKAPTINIPNTFAGSFFYTIKFTWLNSSSNLQQVSWQVGRFIPTAECNAVATISCSPNYIRGGTYELLSTFLITTVPIETLGAQFFVNANPVKTVRPSTALSNIASLSGTASTFTYDLLTSVVNSQIVDDNEITDNNFGGSLHFYDDYWIASMDGSRYSVIVGDWSGNILQKIPRQNANDITTTNLCISPNGNYFGFIENQPNTNNTIRKFYLYKRNSLNPQTFTLFNNFNLLQDDDVVPDFFSNDELVVSNDYIVVSYQTTFTTTSLKKADIFVYEINHNNTTIDYLYTITENTGTASNYGEAIAIDIANDYLIIQGDNDIDAATPIVGYFYEVRNITNGNLIRTIDNASTTRTTNSKSLVAENGLLYLPNEIWNTTTGTLTGTVAPPTFISTITNQFYITSAGEMYRKSTGTLYADLPSGYYLDEYGITRTATYYTDNVLAVNQGTPDTLTLDLNEVDHTITNNTSIRFFGSNVSSLGLLESATYYIIGKYNTNDYAISETRFGGSAKSLTSGNVSGITYEILTGSVTVRNQE